MALDDDILDYYSIVPQETAPKPRPASIFNPLADALHYLTHFRRSSTTPAITRPDQKTYPNDLSIQCPHIPSSYELRDPVRPFIYFFDLLEAAIDRMQFEAGQERTYHLKLDPGSFGSFITSLVHIDQERHPRPDNPQPPQRDIKEGLAEYAAERLGPKGYTFMGVSMNYTSHGPSVTVTVLKEKNAVP